MSLPPPDADGRVLPAAPMPPELAALVDVAKRDTSGPVDTPAELGRRLATLDEARARRTPLARVHLADPDGGSR